ncbi:alpha/beta fold hydrolase [Aurantimonas sp. HBX-1]|uniref:alpha/beta fold hydrolase n=1 Tax=Aurantimonas sp. HBX-1 TaxID=2906072 RepID=UPI001F42BF2A|nr:alpha/beta hydrolase [Aurantimonas sp. HBX-1]UIJ71099.1 alpha/beta hydrolase [Aurantimonas sp. HBX-1]
MKAADAAQTVERQHFTVRSSDGVALSVEAQGDPDAPEILFIHGLRQSRLSWDKQFDDPRLSAFRMVRFDLRGHGDSGKPDDPESYADPRLWADDVKAVIEGAGLKRPVLVGWSLGGYVAGAYLHAYPGAAVAGLNLVDAVVAFSPEFLTPLAAQFAQSVMDPDLAVRTEATAAFLLACFHVDPTPDEFDRMLVVNGMTPPAVNEGLLKLPLADLRPTLEAFRGPILLSHGVHDRLVRVAMSESVRAIHPDSEMDLYEKSGHSPFWEEAKSYNRNLAAFMKRSGG